MGPRELRRTVDDGDETEEEEKRYLKDVDDGVDLTGNGDAAGGDEGDEHCENDTEDEGERQSVDDREELSGEVSGKEGGGGEDECGVKEIVKIAGSEEEKAEGAVCRRCGRRKACRT